MAGADLRGQRKASIMARDTRPITKQSRREGTPLHPKAMRIMIKRTSPPGQHGNDYRQKKPGQYALQLREKQKVRRIYGLLERQFAKMIHQALRQKQNTGQTLIELLERRLDNVIYRAGFAPSRQAARQLVSHSHFMMNGQRTNIPSTIVKPGDEIKLRPQSAKNDYFSRLDDIMENSSPFTLSWLKTDRSDFSISVLSIPLREESEQDINEQLIVEYYSR